MIDTVLEVARQSAHCPLMYDGDISRVRCASKGCNEAFLQFSANLPGPVTIASNGIYGLWRNVAPRAAIDALRVFSRIQVCSSNVVLQDGVTVERLREAAVSISATFLCAFRFAPAGDGLAFILNDLGGVTDAPHASGEETITMTGNRQLYVCLELWRNPLLSESALMRAYAHESSERPYTWYTEMRLPDFPGTHLSTINGHSEIGPWVDTIRYAEVRGGGMLWDFIHENRTLNCAMRIDDVAQGVERGDAEQSSDDTGDDSMGDD